MLLRACWPARPAVLWCKKRSWSLLRGLTPQLPACLAHMSSAKTRVCHVAGLAVGPFWLGGRYLLCQGCHSSCGTARGFTRPPPVQASAPPRWRCPPVGRGWRSSAAAQAQARCVGAACDCAATLPCLLPLLYRAPLAVHPLAAPPPLCCSPQTRAKGRTREVCALLNLQPSVVDQAIHLVDQALTELPGWRRDCMAASCAYAACRWAGGRQERGR